MTSIESLTERVKQLEHELSECRQRDDTWTKSKCTRPKINELSAEVVDSNPYRLLDKLHMASTNCKHNAASSDHRRRLIQLIMPVMHAQEYAKCEWRSYKEFFRE